MHKYNIKLRYLILLFLLSSCGQTFYIKKAERALKKAEQLGADVSADTIYKDLKVVGAKATFNLGNTILQRNEFQYERLKLKDTTIYQNNIKIQFKDSLIYVDCPDNDIKVPTSVNTKIESGHSTWDVLKWCLIVLVVAVLLTRLLWR